MKTRCFPWIFPDFWSNPLGPGVPHGRGHQPRRPRRHYHGAQRHGAAARAAQRAGGATDQRRGRDDDRVPRNRRGGLARPGKKQKIDDMGNEN